MFYILKINPLYVKHNSQKKKNQKKFVRTNFLNEQTKRIFLVFFLNMMMKITMMMMMMGWCTNNLMMIWWCKWLVNGLSVPGGFNVNYTHNGDYVEFLELIWCQRGIFKWTICWDMGSSNLTGFWILDTGLLALPIKCVFFSFSLSFFVSFSLFQITYFNHTRTLCIRLCNCHQLQQQQPRPPRHNNNNCVLQPTLKHYLLNIRHRRLRRRRRLRQQRFLLNVP